MKITAERVCKVLEEMYNRDMHEIPENNFLDLVYKCSHVALGECENKHEDWVEDFIKTEKYLMSN